MMKLRMKISGCFPTKRGEKDFAIMRAIKRYGSQERFGAVGKLESVSLE